MENTDFVGFIKLMQDEYGAAYGANAVRLAWDKLKTCNKKSMLGAMDKVMLSNTHLPPLDRIISETLRIEQEVRAQEVVGREIEAQREKEAFRHGQAKAFGGDKGIAKQTLLLVRGILSGKVSRGQALEGMRHLDQAYPQAGFATSGAMLSNWYAKSELSLSKPCGSRPWSAYTEELCSE